MECLYVKEHGGCINFMQEDEAAIRIIDMDGKSRINEPAGLGRLAILLKGEIRFSYSGHDKVLMRALQMFFLPVGHAITFASNEDSCLALVRIDSKIHFCDSFRMEQLIPYIQKKEPVENGLPSFSFLPVNSTLESILRQVEETIATGYRCRIYFEIKTEEIFMMLRFYYTKEQLSCLFREIIYADSFFAYKIIHNYHRFHTLSGLAAYMGMTVEPFDRRFKRIFGKSGYKWMNERKKRDIYHAITTDNESFKELSIKFGFCSPSAFNDYCKTYLGNTPGEIRQKAKTLNMEWI